MSDATAKLGIMTDSVVLPGLYFPSDVRVSEAGIAGGRLWLDVARRAATVTLVPDLSRDVLLTAGGPVLTERTVSPTPVSLVRGTAVAGIRLPIAATSINIDHSWSGWKSSRSPDDVLADALATGALTWTIDRLVADYVRLAGGSPPDVGGAARATFVSERTLRRRLTGAIGVGPSAIRRILRLHRLARWVQGYSIPDAVSLAGFADQSHAYRDVRKLTGMPLRQFARHSVAD